MPTDDNDEFHAAKLSDKAKASLDAPTMAAKVFSDQGQGVPCTAHLQTDPPSTPTMFTMTSLFKPFTFIALFLTLAACAGGGSGPGSLTYVANKSGNNTNPVYDFSDVDTRDATDSKGQGFSPRSIATTRTLQ
jgi:hypothetical protein